MGAIFNEKTIFFNFLPTTLAKENIEEYSLVMSCWITVKFLDKWKPSWLALVPSHI